MVSRVDVGEVCGVEFSGCLRARQAAEAKIDDCDFGTLTFESGIMKVRCSSQRHALARHSEWPDRVRLANERNAGNLILAVNTLNWMTARELSMGIPPRDVEDLSLYIGQQKMRIIQIVVLLVMPGAAIAMGVLVWRRRRH